MTPLDKLEHFNIVRRADGSLWELGRGAMGVTYKAWDTRLHCDVALKVVHPNILDNADARDRFQREARAAAQLRHQNIAAAHHLGQTEDGDSYYVMEFCDGPTLHEAVAERGVFDAGEALKIALQVARALSAAESNGIVHRDIKPSNIILTQRRDEGTVVKVIDFGLARSFNTNAAQSFATMGGGFMGTAHFASPEQLEEREVDIRSDFYALGVCLWFMLTGKPIFEGSLARVMSQALSSEPPWEKLAGQPPTLVNLLQCLLAKDPDERPYSTLALRDQIESSLRRLTEERVPKPRPQPILQQSSPSEVRPVNLPSKQPAAPITSTQPRRESLTQTTRKPVPTAASEDHVLGRFLPVAEIERDALGTVLEGTDAETGESVRIRVLDASVMAVPLLRRRIEERVRALEAHPHPALPRVLGFGDHAGDWTLVSSNVGGITLLDLLKARHALRPREAMKLLEPVAEALAHAEAIGIGQLEPHLSTIRVQPQQAAGAEHLLQQSVTEWPRHQVIVDALAFDHEQREATTATLTSMRTQAGPESGPPSSGSTKSNAAGVATLFYELLGGTTSKRGQYVPLSRLTEAGNQVLRETLQGTVVCTAADMLARLRDCAGVEIVPTTSGVSKRPNRPNRRSRSHASFKHAARIIATCLAVLLIGGAWGAWHLHLQNKSEDERKERTAKAEQEAHDLEEKQRLAETQRQLATAQAEAEKQKQLAEQSAKLRADADKKLKDQAVAQAKALAETKIKEETDARAKMLAETQLVETERKIKEEAIAQAKVMVEKQLKEKAESERHQGKYLFSKQGKFDSAWFSHDDEVLEIGDSTWRCTSTIRAYIYDQTPAFAKQGADKDGLANSYVTTYSGVVTEHGSDYVRLKIQATDFRWIKQSPVLQGSAPPSVVAGGGSVGTILTYKKVGSDFVDPTKTSIVYKRQFDSPATISNLAGTWSGKMTTRKAMTGKITATPSVRYVVDRSLMNALGYVNDGDALQLISKPVNGQLELDGPTIDSPGIGRVKNHITLKSGSADSVICTETWIVDDRLDLESTGILHRENEVPKNTVRRAAVGNGQETRNTKQSAPPPPKGGTSSMEQYRSFTERFFNR